MTTTVQSPESKIITEKERQPREGSYGLFVNYRTWGTTKFGVGGQFGVAMSLDNPGAMYGLSFNVSPYVTAGVGMGSFRVKALDPSLTTGEGGSSVYSDADIKTRTFWDETYYFSISVNINELPLFK